MPVDVDGYRRRKREATRRWHANNRAKVLSGYGNACACCGETEPRFLTVDHIDDNGAEHRREYDLGGSYRFYAWLKRNNFPPGFQILCFNCNNAKAHGHCPHEETIDA